MHAQGLSGAQAPGQDGGDSSVIYLSPSRRWLVTLAMLMLCPWLVAAWLLSPWSPLASAAAPVDGPIPARKSVRPWGKMEYTEITISPPLEFIDPKLIEVDAAPVVAESQANSDLTTSDLHSDLQVDVATDLSADGQRWYFPDFSREELEQLLAQAELTPAQLEQFKSTISRRVGNRGYELSPSDESIRTLSVKSRGILYQRLAQSDLNEAQRGAFRFRSDSVEHWLSRANLQPTTIDLVKSFTYRQGPFLFFADLKQVLPEIEQPEERLRLAKALSRERTMLAKLHVDRNSDIEALVNYWGRGGRAKDVRPILESVSQLPGGGTIDITHLLPPLARRRIYTFPAPVDDPMSVRRNSHWTALNFFNDTPDDRYVDSQVVADALDEDYYRIFGNLALGDLVMFVQNEREAFHTAVYLADDVLYTKSGNQSAGPWVLMKMDDVKDYYAKQGMVNLIYFRRRDL